MFAVPQAGNFGGRASADERLCARRFRDAKSVFGFLVAFLLILSRGDGGDESQQITVFDLSQIHKFTIYMN
ncbi:hypothetical protein QO058_10165 [Bosea vestrisii]|uniref:hypothetical protein n=1 Tax=Bosea vestrisii TaxID=151416 RepID=UPI0024DF7FEA|nr:hypothetical protein [Bosea vestrisii]WID98563.1 hypothetical protein QO058_10165 [Bosea vestrisii]